MKKSAAQKRLARSLRTQGGQKFIKELKTRSVFEILDLDAVKRLKLGGRPRVLKREAPHPKPH